jgi:hypothetical protein
MCENISINLSEHVLPDNKMNPYYNIGYINKIKKLLNVQKENPKLIIETIDISKDRKINIIQEGYLISGTKQRVVTDFIKKVVIKNKKIKTLLYAGSSNGFGAIACAYAAYKLGLKSHVFLSENNDSDEKNKIYDTRQINTLHALNANINMCNSFRKARNLEYKLGFENTISWKPNEEYYVCPMGFNDDNKIMVNLLSKKINKAMKNTLLSEMKNPRIWLVTGSGGILMALHKSLPNAHFIILLTGGAKYKDKIINWSSEFNNIEILKNDSFLNNKKERLNRKSYYSSVENYDDLIWPYIKKFGKSNDFIWNVSSDDYIY